MMARPLEDLRCRLKQVVPHNHDTSIFIFEGPVSNHVIVSCRGVSRPYTPIAYSPESFERLNLPQGDFALLVKRYREWGSNGPSRALKESYRPAGIVSNCIHDGESLVISPGTPKTVPKAKRINMIAVGAGIAPMIQALQRILFEGDEEVVLLYGNRSVDDILMRTTLDEWARRFPERFKVVYAVGSRWSNVKMGAKGTTTTLEELKKPPVLPGYEDLPVSANQNKALGWVGRDVIQAHAFPPHPHTLTYVCGLPSVYNALCGPRDDPACSGVLADLGYDATHVVKF